MRGAKYVHMSYGTGYKFMADSNKRQNKTAQVQKLLQLTIKSYFFGSVN